MSDDVSRTLPTQISPKTYRRTRQNNHLQTNSELCLYTSRDYERREGIFSQPTLDHFGNI